MIRRLEDSDRSPLGVSPRVSLLIAMRNEERFIAGTLETVLGQEYPEDQLEVIVADGQSTDGSRAIVEEFAQRHANVRVLDNPERIQSVGWNLGIAASTGEVVGIVSAHCELDSRYVAEAIDTLRRSGADMVGGPMRASSEGMLGRTIACATSSPFGVGDARFHYATEESEVDTVYQGLCRRSLYERLGGFDTEMVRNQDDELSFRIRRAGGRIVCNPSIVSRYHNRATIRSLWRQYHQYGFWKVRLMQKIATGMRWRHFVPAAFVLALVALPMIGWWWKSALWLWCVILLAYVGGASVAAVRVARSAEAVRAWRIARVFPVLHVAYGTGFLRGLAWWPFVRSKSSTIPAIVR